MQKWILKMQDVISKTLLEVWGQWYFIYFYFIIFLKEIALNWQL